MSGSVVCDGVVLISGGVALKKPLVLLKLWMFLFIWFTRLDLSTYLLDGRVPSLVNQTRAGGLGRRLTTYGRHGGNNRIDTNRNTHENILHHEFPQVEKEW